MSLKGATQALLPIGIIAVIFAMLIVYYFPLSCRKCSRTVEGFNTMNQPVTMCPEDSRSFYDKKGNLNCCSGNVDHDMCQGTVVCTFSASAEGGIPFCNELSRRRKFLGEVNPFVRKFLQSAPRSQYQLILNGFKQIVGNVMQIPDDKLSAADKQKLQALLQEEERFFANESNASTKLAVYEDEVMYTIQQLENMFRNSPLLQDKAYIQQQTKKMVCSMQ